jgi:ABC-type lipopolysaccharide export system ATPase subunit
MIRDIENKSKKELIEMLEIAQHEYRELKASLKKPNSVILVTAHNQYGINEIIAITDKLSKAESIKKGYKQKIIDNIYVEMQYWDIL